MNKNAWIGVGILVVVVVGFLFFGSGSTGAVVRGDYQEVVIDMQNWVYFPSVVRVKKDVPARIYLTDNVMGCFRDLIFPGMRISKYLATSKDYVEITFTEGRYTFACSMYMGEGVIVAE